MGPGRSTIGPQGVHSGAAHGLQTRVPILRHHQIASGGRASSRVFRSFVSLLFCEPLTRFTDEAEEAESQADDAKSILGNIGSIIGSLQRTSALRAFSSLLAQL